MKFSILLTVLTAAVFLIAPWPASAADGVYTNGTWSGSFKEGFGEDARDPQYSFIYTISGNEEASIQDSLNNLMLEIGVESTIENVGDLFVTDIEGAKEILNEALPIDLYAVKFDVDPTTGIAVIDFYASRPPVWGNLFAHSSDSKHWAYNAGFNAVGEGNKTSDDLLALTVSGPTGAVTITNPEPGTLLILGSGLALAAAGRRFKKMKKAG